MMTKLGSVGVLAALMMAMGSAACVEQPVTELGSGKSAASSDDDDEPTASKSAKKKSLETAEAAEEDQTDEESTVTKPSKTDSAADAKAEAPKKELALDLDFAGSKGLKFGNIAIRRSCSDIGVDFNQASVAEGTSLSLVEVYSKKVLLTVQGADLAAIKKSLLDGDGHVNIPVQPGQIPTQATEYAIVMGGDSRFGSLAACGVNIVPKSDEDRGIKGGAGHFPTGRNIFNAITLGGDGCGIVGFVQAYYDEKMGAVYARATSPILIAADDEGRAGFPRGSGYAGCDEHASPLVLDLSGNGISLSKTREDMFDIDANGTRDSIGWVSSNDTPFLVRDANGNGLVDGATELFGNFTDKTSANGFDALSHFDNNGDGTVDSNDTVWSTLRLWFDKNHDGRTDAGELVTLESRGVASIATRYISVNEKLMSGAIRQRGAVTMTDGRSVPVLDVWFDRQF